MRNTLLLIVITLIAGLFVACSGDKEKKEEVSYRSEIVGLASPIQLKLKETTLLLSDYFVNYKGITSVQLNEQALSIDSNGVVLVPQNILSPVGNLQVVCNLVVHDIPVFASEKLDYHFTYKSASNVTKVNLAGSINGWSNSATPLTLNTEQGYWETHLELDPGSYEYRIWENGVEKLDANNPEQVSNGMGGMNSLLKVGPQVGNPPTLVTTKYDETKIELQSNGNVQHVLAYFQNVRIPVEVNGNTITIAIPPAAKNLDRSYIRVYADDNVRRTNDVLVPLTHGDVLVDEESLNRSDWRSAVMYFAMVDRFSDGNPANNRPTNDPKILPQANNLGGDIKGITKKINSGYFEKLGVNTIWISPISQNAEGAWGLWDKGVTSTFSAYHGYWPTSLTRIDDRFGTEEELRELIDVAHKNDMNVVLDYVAHHVHQDHPLYKEHKDWTTDLYLPDGSLNTERWNDHRLTTWFDTFLPTWDFAQPQVVDALTDTAMYWVTNYELDGFRHDATKHIREEFWRTLTRKMKERSPDKTLFQIGETYGSPELISSYINSGQMDAQFDFNLYDAAVDAFAKGETDFANLSRVMNQSMHFYGAHHLMGNITGNQDRARFTSYADGGVQFNEDPKLAGWTRSIQNNGTVGFQRMEMLNAFLMTAPGIPCIYYGDEIGMPGGNDPDNRRMMTFEGWTPDQQKLHNAIAKLVHLRRSHLVLIYGDTFVLEQYQNHFAFVRNYFGKTAVVIFKKGGDEPLNFTLPEGISKDKLKSLNGSKFTLDGNKLQVIMKGSYEVIYN